MNILTLLPANYSNLHQPFQTWTLRIISQVHIVANVKLQGFVINPMAINNWRFNSQGECEAQRTLFP